MSDKPREWWIAFGADGEYVSTEPPDENQYRDEVRVIEYSAYEAVVARAERAESTSDQYHDKIQSLIKERDACIKAHDEHVAVFKEHCKLLAEGADHLEIALKERDELQVKLNERTAVMQDSGDIVRSLFQGSEVSKRILNLTEERDEARAEWDRISEFNRMEAARYEDKLTAERANSAIKEKNKQRCHRMYRELEAKAQKLVEALKNIEFCPRSISENVICDMQKTANNALAEYSATTPDDEFKLEQISREEVIQTLKDAGVDIPTESSNIVDEANRFFKKAWENAKINADTYDREWVAIHPGHDTGFMANHWRAAEQHIQMCWAGFKVTIASRQEHVNGFPDRDETAKLKREIEEKCKKPWTKE